MNDDARMRRLNARLAAIPVSVKEALQPALDKGANEIAAQARRNAPQDEGDLVRTIRVEAGPHSLSRDVRAGGPATTKDGYDYAAANEYGTQEMQAQPFMRPAKNALAKRVSNRLKREARKAVKAAWGQK